MKNGLFLIILLLIFISAKAQSDIKTIKSSHYDVAPSFIGGDTELRTFIAKNLNYPDGQHAEGKVIVSFLILETGRVDSLKVEKSLNALCDEEALRLIKKFPKWTPGTLRGKPVVVKYFMPVRF